MMTHRHDSPEAQAYMIADNKLTDESDWNYADLEIIFEDLKLEDFEVELTGFDQNQIQEVEEKLHGPQEITEDDFDPEGVVETIVQPGDIWELGNHRLMCGDSTKPEDVELLVDYDIDMVFTDPPYSVNYEKKTKEIFGNTDYNKITNDDLSVEEIASKVWGPAFKNMYNVATDKCSFYMTAPQGGDQMMMMMMMMIKENWQLKHELIWVKNNPVFSMGRLDYDYQHEPILYGWKKSHEFYGKGNFTKSVWHIERTKENKLHPTMKPIQLIANALMNSSLVGDNVLDLFGGSGSTLIACEQLNRRCYMMELDPHYCDVIITRWETFTGQKAHKTN